MIAPPVEEQRLGRGLRRLGCGWRRLHDHYLGWGGLLFNWVGWCRNDWIGQEYWFSKGESIREEKLLAEEWIEECVAKTWVSRKDVKPKMARGCSSPDK